MKSNNILLICGIALYLISDIGWDIVTEHRLNALEQSQKVIHGWIAVDNGGMSSNEVFNAVNNPQFHYWVSHENGKTNEHVELVPANSN